MFNACVELPVEERDSFLRDQCAGDDGLRAEVEALVGVAREVESALVEAPAADADPLTGRTFDDYEILELIGRGGSGAVYLARQNSTDRLVALKILQSLFRESRVQQRFEKEARVLGSLEHPNIARLYDVGKLAIGGMSAQYIAMEWVRAGLPLTTFAREHDLRLDARLALFVKVCRTIEHAHEWGIVHRDLKPANVLVDGAGEVKVIDFGIARSLEETGGLTASGDVLGTPAYMSPEQLLGEVQRVGPRSDVYALGVMLYELLTSKLPYGEPSGSLASFTHRVSTKSPEAPSGHDTTLRGDLEILLLRSLEQDPSLRIGSASELADELERVLRREPIEARRDNALYVLRKRMARNRVAMSVAGVLVLVLTVASAVSVSLLLDAEDAREESERSRYVGQIALAAEAMRNLRVVEMRSILADTKEAYRGWEWGHLRARSDDSIRKVEVSNAVTYVEASADGTRLLTYGRDHLLRVWSAETLELLRTIKGHDSVIDRAFFFGEDLDQVLSASRDRTVRLFDIATGEELRRFDHEEEIYSLEVSVRHGRFISGMRDGSVNVWDLDQAEGPIHSAKAHSGPVGWVDLSPSGQLLMTSGQREIGLWSCPKLEPLQRFDSDPWSLFSGEASTLGTRNLFVDEVRVLTTSSNGLVHLWDLEAGTLIAARQLGRDHNDVIVSERLGVIALASFGAVHLLEAETGVAIPPLLGHEGRALSVAFIPGTSRLASTSYRGELRLFDLQNRHAISFDKVADERIDDIACSGDGSIVAIATVSGELIVWDAETSREIRRVRLDIQGRPYDCALSPRGDRIACATENRKRIAIVDTNSGARLFDHPSPHDYVAWNDSGLFFAGPGERVEHAKANKLSGSGFESGGQVSVIDASASLIAVADDKSTIRVFSHEGELRWSFLIQDSDLRVSALQISPDEHVLAWASWNATGAFSLSDGSVKFHRRRASVTSRIRFSSDGERIFELGDVVRVVDAATGVTLLDLKSPMTSSIMTSLEILPGDRLMMGDDRGNITMWSPRREVRRYVTKD